MRKSVFQLLLSLFAISSYSQHRNQNLIVGTYTNSCDSQGIYVYDFNTETAEFQLKNHTENVINPSYLTISPDGKFIYSVNENGQESSVSSFYFDTKSGATEFLGKQNSNGADPCYIINDETNVIVANYSGGTISVFEKNKFGALKEAKQVIKHSGKGKNAQRQESPHVHMVYFSPDKKFVLSNDLGTDEIYVYKYNPEARSNVLELKTKIAVKPGSGPRHLAFSNEGRFVYLLQELDGTLTTFSYANGNLKKIDEPKIIADDFEGEISAADIHISPDGKFLYATNRGTANDISIFEINKNGKLNFVDRIATGGKGPRNFTIDPSGNYLLVGHQYTNDIVIFSVDKTTGKLTDTGKKIKICSPVCLVFSEK